MLHILIVPVQKRRFPKRMNISVKQILKEKLMGLLDFLLNKKKDTKIHADKEVSGKCLELLGWKQYLDGIADSEHYISRKELVDEIAQYSETMKFFLLLDKNDILEDYCLKNGFDSDIARDLCYQYEHIDEIIAKTNDTYVASKLIEE